MRTMATLFKAAVRTVKMITMSILVSDSLLRYASLPSMTTGCLFSPRVLAICAVLATICGIFTAVSYRPSKTMNKKKGPYLIVLYAKFAIVLLLTPILDKAVSPSTAISVRFFSVITIVLMSVFLKFYREANTTNEKSV